MNMPEYESTKDETVNDFGAGPTFALGVLTQIKRDHGLSGEDMRDPARMRAKVEANGGGAMSDGLLDALIMMDNATLRVMPELYRDYGLRGEDMSTATRMQARVEANRDKGMSNGLLSALDAMNKAAAQILVNLPAHYGLTAWDIQDFERTRAKAYANGARGKVVTALLWMQRHYDKIRS